jgi:hypothetical protein
MTIEKILLKLDLSGELLDTSQTLLIFFEIYYIAVNFLDRCRGLFCVTVVIWILILRKCFKNIL